MKKNKILAIILCLILCASLLQPAAVARAAETGGAGSDSGMHLEKTATANEDGTYTIRLEAYATGSKVITEETKEIPTDIILVLDQSGSMADPIGAVSFSAYTNTTNASHYRNRHNGGEKNLYYPLSDGQYVSVSVSVEQFPNYSEIDAQTKNSYYYSNQNNLYASVNGIYEKVSVTWSYSWSDRIYTYKLENGTVIAAQTGGDGIPQFSGIDGNVLYLLSVDDSQNVYTYTYTDASGDTHTIGTSTGANAQFETTLYRRTVDANAGEKRIAALQSALRSFINSVNGKAAGADGQLGTEDDVNHRVAVVGFASESGYGNNTELLSIHGSNSGSVGVRYGNIKEQDYKDVLQNMNTAGGQDMVNAAVNALAAQGATRADLGMEMANRILNANPVPEGEKRARVVIFFTDGSPTSSSSFESSVANAAISVAGRVKSAGVDVYSVGVFSGADATSAGIAEGNSSRWENQFMQSVSSNNGTPRNPSYYLSAADSATLSNIFQKISDNIETGGSSTTLNSESVIKDIISPQFTLPEGASASDIILKTYAYTGEGQWEENGGAMGATASINENGEVSVTGFDFAGNYVGTVTENGTPTYRGNKLVISFTVVPKDGFLGGNNVYTNTSAGVYENGSAEDPVLTFDRPQVNVPIGDVTVTAEDKNVYLLGDLTAGQIRGGITAKVGDVPLDLSKENFGLEPWQNEYVDITVTVTDSMGNVLGSLSELLNDETYTVTVTVKPKSDGENADGDAAAEKSGSACGQIHVFKPELTYVDTWAYYGGDVPTEAELASCLSSARWVHGETEADESKMGSAPALSMTYAPKPDMLDSTGKIINTKQDIPVDVTVKLGQTDVSQYTAFKHTDCDGMTCRLPENSAFLIHVATCELTVTKEGGETGETYIMDVYKDGNLYTQVTVAANSSVSVKELPVGTYSVQENESWAWRYTSSVTGPVALSGSNHKGTITCSNTKDNNQWLSHSAAAQNTYGTANS